MRIGIDGTPLATPYPCGTKTYATNLIYNLAEIDRDNQYFIFCAKVVKIPIQANFHLVKTPSILPIFKRQLFLSFYAARLNLDLFHYLLPYGDVFFKHTKIFTTVHDLNLSETYPLLSKFFLNRIICEATRLFVFKYTTEFIVDSVAIKEELVRYVGRGRVKRNCKVIYPAPSRIFTPLKGVDNHNVGKYILCMADFSKRKNPEKIFEAYSTLPKKQKEEYSLYVIVSTKKEGLRIKKLALEKGLNTAFKLFIGPNDKKIAKLYRHATVFLYPSTYEGFGFPILEAMASGCPVITSSYGAMKEVAGGAAALVNPRFVISIREAIIKITNDKKFRNTLIKKGLRHASAFLWRKTAEKTLLLYKSK